MNMNKRILLSAPTILFAVIIFILSHNPQPYLPKLGIAWEDKILHLIAYFIFGITLIPFFLANFNYMHANKIILWVMIIGCSYGAFDEIHQYFIPGRYMDFLDWVADCVGIILSLMLFKSLKNKIIRKMI